MPELNKDYKTRDMIIFGKEIDWDNDPWGGALSFRVLTLAQLEQLKEENFLDPEGTQNESPKISEFMEFMKEFPGVTAHGYAVSPKRKDYRITLEGLKFRGECSCKMQLEFSKLCRRANDLRITNAQVFCWYD